MGNQVMLKLRKIYALEHRFDGFYAEIQKRLKRIKMEVDQMKIGRFVLADTYLLQ
jgi:hypothetical protein